MATEGMNKSDSLSGVDGLEVVVIANGSHTM